MQTKLVIVESPAKAKTIKKYLGKNYEVMASMGHVRDLPKSTLGVDVDHDFTPKYLNIRKQSETIKGLQAAAKKSDKIYLATDPDREGEAISWHLANILKLDTVDMDYIKKLDRPQQPNYDVKDVIKYLKMFKGHVIIQTMFLRGDGLDNTSEHFVAPWLEAVKDIQPQQVMVYTIARETPDKLLEKAPKEVLDAIKERVEVLGIKCTASY